MESPTPILNSFEQTNIKDEEIEIIEKLRLRLDSSANDALTNHDCVRFLRARNRNLDKAEAMIKAWWSWWKKPTVLLGLSPSNILLLGIEIEYPKEEHLQTCFPMSFMGEDKSGRPILWEKTGELSRRFSETKKIFELEEMALLHVHDLETAIRRMDYLSKKYGHRVHQIVLIQDLKNLNYMPDYMAFQVLQAMITIDEAYYPERLYKAIFINAPSIFTAIWSIVRPWLDTVTANKYSAAGPNFISELRESIDDSQIPVEYGGTFHEFRWTPPWPESSGCSTDQIKSYLKDNNITFASTSDSDNEMKIKETEGDQVASVNDVRGVEEEKKEENK